MGGSGLYGFFLRQAPPIADKKRLEKWQRRCIGYLSRQIIRKVNSANAQCGLAKTGDRVALDESNR